MSIYPLMGGIPLVPGYQARRSACCRKGLCRLLLMPLLPCDPWGLPRLGSNIQFHRRIPYRRGGCNGTWILLHRRHTSLRLAGNGFLLGSFLMFHRTSYGGRGRWSRSPRRRSGWAMYRRSGRRSLCRALRSVLLPNPCCIWGLAFSQAL